MAVSPLLRHDILKREIKARKLTEEAFAEQLGITDRHLRNLITKDTNSSCSVVYRIIEWKSPWKCWWHPGQMRIREGGKGAAMSLGSVLVF